MIRPALTIVMLLCFSQAANAQTPINSLQYLNVQRAYFGLAPLLPDPQLQAAAEAAVVTRARRGIGGHLKQKRVRGRGRRWRMKDVPVAGRAEGTGYRSSREIGSAGRPWDYRDVYACYQATGSGLPGAFDFKNYQYAGCASALGADGRWYYQFNMR